MKRFMDFLNRPGVGLGAALLLAFAWTSALPWWRPGTVFDERFVVFDQGQNLFLVDGLLAGKRLYRDVFSQYGPLPAYAQAAWAACFGNTARTHLALMQLLTLVNVALLYRLLRRSVAAPVALGWLAFVVFPFLLLPGSFNAGETGMTYPGFERCALLCIALAWVDPHRRTPWQACVLGLLLGSMQLVKFGGAFVAGAALLLTDLLVLGTTLTRPEGRRGCLKIMLCTLAGFLAVEGLWAAAAFLALPAPIARDVLWPLYMLKNYASYTNTVPHYVSWVNLRYFVEAQGPVAIAALLNLGLLWRVLMPRRKDAGAADRQGPMLFFAAYFPLAVAIYLPHVWLAIVSAWIFLAAGAYGFAGLRWPARGVVLLGMLPCFFVSVKSVLPGPWHGEKFATMDFPNGERLWMTPGVKEGLAKTEAVVKQLAAPGGSPLLIIFPVGSGWFHYYPDYRHFGRHGFPMAGFVRPDEETALVGSLAETTAVIVYSPEGVAASLRADPGSWPIGLNPFFSPATNAAFVRQLGAPMIVDAHCVVFPVRH